MKRVLVMPVKNEAWILPRTLACASLWADHIIVADQQSTDGTLAVCSAFPKVTVVENTARFHSSSVRKLLLDTARQYGKNNVIFSFDADEVPTGEILGEAFWRDLAAFAPGTAIELQWLNLWRWPTRYRTDGIMGPSWKPFGFIDDGTMEYTTVNVINDHTSRIPVAAMQPIKRLPQPKVLHYQFANWQRTVSKQAHYRMTEWLQKSRNFLTAVQINLKYYPTKDESGLTLSPVPDQWISPYESAGVPLREPFEDSPSWHDAAALSYMSQYGPDYFSLLDIWDIDWEKKAATLAMAEPAMGRRTATGRFGFFLGMGLVRMLGFHGWFLKVYTYLRKLL